MDKTQAGAIIKCLQKKKHMTPEDTLALNCYRTFLIHQIQPRLTFISSLNSNHTFLVASLEKSIVEDFMGNQGATVFREGIAMHEHRWTKCIDVEGGTILNSGKLS